jgi:hypothetical protein
MGEWRSHDPTNSIDGTQHSIHEAICARSSTTTKCGHHWRIRFKEHANIAAIQSNTNQMGEGTANIAYELGRLHIAPPEQFIGGSVQTYYEQGYNNQDYQYQPPVEE